MATASYREEAAELADAIMTGIRRRPVQSFGEYFGENGGSDALGAAYEGIFLLPRDVRGFHPRVWLCSTSSRACRGTVLAAAASSCRSPR